MGEFSLALPFDTDNADFRRGVEIGMLYMRLFGNDSPVDVTVHADCAEMIVRIAEAYGLPFTVQWEPDDTWLHATVGGR